MSIAEKLTTIAENEQKVFDAGKQTAYDAVWEAYQQSGRRTDYSNAFRGGRFTDETFRPKYDIRPTKSDYMFAYQGYESEECITDLAARLEEAGVVLDTSQCTNFGYMFYVANRITHIPAISLEGSTDGIIDALFTHANALETIDCLIFKEDGSDVLRPDSWGAPFYSCVALKDITIRGKIGCTISFAHSPLLKASIKSIMDALLSTASSKTLTFKLTAVKKAFETSSGANDGNTSEEWLALVASKSNWTITLA